MKHTILFLAIFLPNLFLYSQVGVGTINPESSAVLDVTSSDKGVMIPRLSLSDVTITQLDGVNNAAEGLLIYNTNSAVTGGSGEGFYYFNGTKWVRLVTFQEAVDADWHKELTSTNPNAITDDIYTEGNVAIGKNTADFPLEIVLSTGERGLNIQSAGSENVYKYGIYTEFSETGNGRNFGLYNKMNGLNISPGRQYGVYNDISVSEPFTVHYGVRNNFDGTGSSGVLAISTYGFENRFTGDSDAVAIGLRNDMYYTGSGIKFGVLNQTSSLNTSSGTIYGLFNNLNQPSTGVAYGVYNDIYGFGTANRYGTFTTIDETSGGTHYGIYSDVQRAGSYSGYFIGNLVVDIDLDETNSNALMYVDTDNNRIGVGTESPAYTLDVNGDINTNGDIRKNGAAYNHPDFVFETYFEGSSRFKTDYRLLTLSEIKDFVKTHNHLPGVQSREEVRSNGWDVTEAVRDNLEKIEELYLYVIEQNRHIEQLESEILKLKKERK